MADEPQLPAEPDEPWGSDPLCNSGGWCWTQPTPFGERVRDIHGTSDGSVVFAVGDNGLVVEARAEGAKYHDTGTTRRLSLVHVLAADDVWVAGDDGLLHYDGVSWSSLGSGEVLSIASTADGHVWAVIDQRLWSVGAELSEVTPDAELSIADVIAGSEPSELWALGFEYVGRGYNVLLLHFDGVSWSRAPGARPFDYTLPRLLRAGSDVYAYERSGAWLASSSWTPVTDWPGAYAAWGNADGTLYLATVKGLLRHSESSTTLLAPDEPVEVWGSSNNDLWVALASGGMTRLPAQRALAATVTPEPLRPARDFGAAEWGTVPAKLWAKSPAAWGSGPNDVWRATLEHFDGERWTQMGDRPNGAVDIDGCGPDDVWFALSDVWYPEEAPSVLQWDGQTFREHALPAEWRGFRVSRIRCMTPTEVWIGAQSLDHARLGSFDGSEWRIAHEVESQPWIEHWGGIDGDTSRLVWIAAADALYRIHGGISAQLLPAANERFVGLDVEGASQVCVLGTQNVYCNDLATGEFTAEPYARNALLNVTLMPEQLWAYDSTRAVRRPR